jgi:hypothetical protein
VVDVTNGNITYCWRTWQSMVMIWLACGNSQYYTYW